MAHGHHASASTASGIQVRNFPNGRKCQESISKRSKDTIPDKTALERGARIIFYLNCLLYCALHVLVADTMPVCRLLFLLCIP